MSARRKQRDAILAILVAARGQWVPLPEITKCAAQYNTRIFELRRLGFRILNRTQDVGGERHSWFRLELSVPVSAPQAASPETQAPLFGEGAASA